ncbi:MAG: hypothetical protein N4A40_10415 [Tissierellales bacterium]|nr:hypothetical protein [Tissierellales bacterium]
MGLGEIKDSKLEKQLTLEYENIISEFNNGKIDEDEQIRKISKIDRILRENNVFIPYSSFEDYVDSLKGLSKKEREYLIKNEDVIMGMDEDASEDESEKVAKRINEILETVGVDSEEAIDQLVNRNIKRAVFNTSGNSVVYENDKVANKLPLSKNDKEEYESLVKKVKTFIPSSILKDITMMEINTDGIENVMAHTVPATEDLSEGKFRLALDIKDIVDENGDLTKDGKETIIHETGHMITLDETQVNDISWEGEGTESADEKFKEGSYIKKFYDKYWTKIISDYLKIQEETGDTFEFYDKYADQFVSDYAATNIEEDIAESFRVFVCKGKPTGNTIADQKVLFFYEYPELLKIREQYRKNL